jgi:dTDP-4-dehydrorhamnose reductase
MNDRPTHRPMPHQALILGASGMVGRAWHGLLTAHGVPHRIVSRPAVDLLNPDSLAAAVEDGDELIVNAAAWTDVDGAEAAEADATRANGDAVGVLAEQAARIGATLVHYSTDYVFRGEAAAPYAVDASIDPVNAYGRSKAAGERQLLDSGCDHLLLRTSWVYAPWGRNFVRTIASLAAGREELRVVNDQRGRPTSAEALAETSFSLYLAGGRGVFHATDAGECTWHEFATEIVTRLGHGCRVLPCSSDEFPRPAKRPAYSVLDLSRTEQLIGPRTDWRTSLARVLERLCH